MDEAEALLDARHARADLLRQDQRIVDALDLAEADVAGAAVAALVGLAEVLDQRLVPALERAGVALHLAQVGDVGFAQLARQLHDPAPLQEVGGRVEQQALGGEAVAAGAAGLLLVVLERLGRAGVHDEAHVGSIDAHAEGDGGDDDVGALVDEGVLVAGALVVGQPGVIRRPPCGRRRRAPRRSGRRPCARCSRRCPLRRDARSSTASSCCSRDEARPHAVDQVRPIEAADEHERVAQPELRGRCPRARASSRSR